MTCDRNYFSNILYIHVLTIRVTPRTSSRNRRRRRTAERRAWPSSFGGFLLPAAPPTPPRAAPAARGPPTHGAGRVRGRCGVGAAAANPSPCPTAGRPGRRPVSPRSSSNGPAPRFHRHPASLPHRPAAVVVTGPPCERERDESRVTRPRKAKVYLRPLRFAPRACAAALARVQVLYYCYRS